MRRSLLGEHLSGGSTSGRIALGTDDVGVIRAEANQPLLVLGAPRTGKTTGFIVPSILEWDGPLIVTSVRRDVVDATIDARRAVGDAQVFEPTGRLGDLPRVGWDPVQHAASWDDAYSVAFWLTDTAAGDGLRDSAFWYGEAHRLLALMLRLARLTGGSMREVVAMLQDASNQRLTDVLERLDLSAAAAEPELLDTAKSWGAYPEVTAGGIRATALSVLRAYQSSDVLNTIAERPFDVDRFLDGGSNTLYLCVPPDAQSELAPIITGLVRHIIGSVYAREASGRPLERSLLVCLDEAGNICRLPDLDRLATTAAGSGIQLVTVFHNMNQAISAYGESAASTIVVNHGGLIVFPGMREARTFDLLDQIIQPDEIPHDVPGAPSSLLQRLQPDEILCLYRHLPPAVLRVRRSYSDPDLLAKALRYPELRR